MTENSTPTPQVVGIINFHDYTLWVVNHLGIEYISFKALVSIAGIQWKRASRGLNSGDNAKLYGSIELNDPVFNSPPGPQGPQKQPYIRLDRARIYLARINTSQVRINNSEDAADKLLALQIEWAEALHNYETSGVAVKSSHLEVRRKEEQNLAALIKTRKDTLDDKERQALTAMITDKLTELGYPPGEMSSPQSELNL